VGLSNENLAKPMLELFIIRFVWDVSLGLFVRIKVVKGVKWCEEADGCVD
jgi:hypothetical protein